MRKKSRMGFVLVGNNGGNAGNNKVFFNLRKCFNKG